MSKKGQLTTADYLPMNDFVYFLHRLREDRQYKWEIYATLAFATALRGGDVAQLRWVDVLNKDVIVIVEQKTGKARRIELRPDTRKKIHELHELSGSPDLRDYVCPNRFGGTMSLTYINIALKQFKEKYKLSIQAFSTHTFRKTFGRHVYESMGKSPEALILLNSIFKHTSIEITKAYIGLRADEISKVYDGLWV